jgi:TRAP-type C4-dicarboxylate transport system permease small subunit
MRRRRLAQMTLATLSLAACLTFFVACVAIVHAEAQGRSSADQINRQLSQYNR